MATDKLKWCGEQNNGIRLIELKPYLSESYIKESHEILENMFSTKGKWRVIMAYYACYNAVYALLMRCGIQCEIHDCTLELMSLFDFSPSEITLIRELKDARIQSQYYLKEAMLRDEIGVKNFVVRCKVVLNQLDSQKISDIRAELKKVLS